MKKVKKHLVWFRNDLRIIDNSALSAACADPDALVAAVFIYTPEQWASHQMSMRQMHFIHEHIKALTHSLNKLNIPLYIQVVDDFKTSNQLLIEFIEEQGFDCLFFNKQYELNERKRDEQLVETLALKHHKIGTLESSTIENSTECFQFDDSLLLPPGSVLTQYGEMFKVYTPFRKAFLARLGSYGWQVQTAPAERTSHYQNESKLFLRNVSPELSFLKPIQQYLPQGSTVKNYLDLIGENCAIEQLREFCKTRLMDYSNNRDFPDIAGTSQLSAYLAIGVLSPRQCLARLVRTYPAVFEDQSSGAFSWLNELIWREFYRHLIVAYPELVKHNPVIKWTDNVIWRNNPDEFEAWKAGKTGFPIVDAAMRQLAQTGWMHNRLRMIVASFLVKDLLIDWRWGEAYFMSQLFDADFAANNGGWQWAASTGCDAAPYFRIFNPTTQSERFDPKGKFIRTWLPELREVPDNYIHEPEKWPLKSIKALNYPAPIVDHKQARVATLAAYEFAKKQQDF